MVCYDGCVFLPPFIMVYVSDSELLYETDAGRKDAGYSEKNDCVVRATATAFGLTYEHAHSAFKSEGRICGRGTQSSIYLRLWDELACACGMETTKHSFPAKKGKKRMNVREFCKSHPVGIFITIQAGHVATVMNGKVCDTKPFAWWHWERCVYTAYEIS
jgi:hypothetical protein